MDIAATFDAQLAPLAPFLIYLLVGAFVFIETAVIFAFFMPGDSLLFSAGLVAASAQNVNIVILCTVIFFAAFIGDQVGFVFGRVIGRPYLDKRTSPRIKKMIASSERFYERSGWWAVVAARFFPWIRTFVPPIAGVSNMNYYKFLSANTLGAILWGVGITLTGFYAGTIPFVKTSAYFIAAFFILGSLISALVNYLRHRR
jgi:membrane-associated protein